MRSEILSDARCGGSGVDVSEKDCAGNNGVSRGRKFIGQEILLDQSSTVEVEDGEEDEMMEDVGDGCKPEECGEWTKTDLERNESGVNRPRTCSA